jgi:hypothetical protein
MSRRNPHYDPRALETFFNSPYLSDFSSFPIGNPKQQQHNHPPCVFDPNIVSDFNSFNQNLHNNYPPIFPKPKQRSIFESRNPFNGPVVQAPDMWRQMQQRNLPEIGQPNFFPPQQYYNFPKKW